MDAHDAKRRRVDELGSEYKSSIDEQSLSHDITAAFKQSELDRENRNITKGQLYGGEMASTSVGKRKDEPVEELTGGKSPEQCRIFQSKNPSIPEDLSVYAFYCTC